MGDEGGRVIKLVYVVRRRSDVSPEEFRRYWLEEHGPLVKSIAPEHGSRRYVQSHTIDTPLNDALVSIRGMSPWYDGITEIWSDSLEAIQATLASEDGQRAFGQLGEDEAKFIDIANSTIFLTEEHTIFDL